MSPVPGRVIVAAKDADHPLHPVCRPRKRWGDSLAIGRVVEDVVMLEVCERLGEIGSQDDPSANVAGGYVADGGRTA